MQYFFINQTYKQFRAQLVINESIKCVFNVLFLKLKIFGSTIFFN